MSETAPEALAPLSNRETRELKGRAQRLEAILKLGKAGVTEGFIKSLDQALKDHELVKLKLTDFKDQRKEIAPQLAEKTGSHLVALVGHVIVLYRPKPKA